ncbi:hypothetical protein [Dysgonomonas sp. 520]|uniref:hypothetical protein n=1 Tax=Dysgonomonas sp. 520 TaxID=2302931 RepID=UPI0013D0B43E|nr:hypothetical protein [Dysgonomonas sp. 520]NDW11139.1 hypothetical protein [Dysgonomonas sp. 520]
MKKIILLKFLLILMFFISCFSQEKKQENTNDFYKESTQNNTTEKNLKMLVNLKYMSPTGEYSILFQNYYYNKEKNQYTIFVLFTMPDENYPQELSKVIEGKYIAYDNILFTENKGKIIKAFEIKDKYTLITTDGQEWVAVYE